MQWRLWKRAARVTLGKCILSRLHRHVGSSISTNINHPRLQRSTGLEEGLGGHNALIYKIQFKRDTSSRKCGHVNLIGFVKE